MPRRPKRLLIHAASGDNVGGVQATFYGYGFAVKSVASLIQSIQAVREAEPVDEESIRRATGTA